MAIQVVPSGELLRPLPKWVRLVDTEWVYAWKEYKWERSKMEEFVSWARTLPWTYFVTQTFRERSSRWSVNSISRVFCRFLAALPSLLAPRVVLWAAELGPMHQRPHLHMLWQMPFKPSPTEWRFWKEQLFKEFGIARVLPFDPTMGAIPYLVKYIRKQAKAEEQGFADWGIWSA